MSRLIVNLGPVWHWQRLDDDGVVTAGAGAPPVGDDATVIAVVPAEGVALHWLEQPDLPPAQAQAAARIALADQVAGVLDDQHVAVAAGPSPRAVAVVATTHMQAWLAELAAAGLTPDHVVPDALLLPVPEHGVTVVAGADRCLVRGARLACAAEPELVALMAGTAPQHAITLSDRDWALAAAAVPLDLRQGSFALRRQWRPAPGQWRRLGRIAVLAVGLWLAGDVTAWVRSLLAAEQAEARLVAAARAALPRDAVVTVADARDQVRARAARVGAGGGFVELAAPVLTVLAGRPDAALERLDYAAASGLQLGWNAGDAAALAADLGAAGVTASPDGAGGTRVTRP